MDNLLSFCIPTYNRADILKQVIELLVPICEKYNLMICVSENASPDHTKDVMESLVAKYSFIKYHRHSHNIGPDDNFEYVLKMPDTKYRWLLSDTCYVKNIDTVIDDLTHNEWDAYIVGGETKSPFCPQTKKIYQESITVMKDLGRHLSWISCMIYNEKNINKMPFKRYKNSSFNQTALIFEPTANRSSHFCFNPNCIVYAMPIIKESAWQWHVFDVFYRQWYEMIMSLPIYYPFDVKVKCCQITDNVNSMYFHAKRRSEGKWSLKDVINNKFFIKKCDNTYFMLLVLAICPQPILKAMFNIGRTIKHIVKK